MDAQPLGVTVGVFLFGSQTGVVPGRLSNRPKLDLSNQNECRDRRCNCPLVPDLPRNQTKSSTGVEHPSIQRMGWQTLMGGLILLAGFSLNYNNASHNFSLNMTPVIR